MWGGQKARIFCPLQRSFAECPRISLMRSYQEDRSAVDLFHFYSKDSVPVERKDDGPCFNFLASDSRCYFQAAQF